MDELEIVELVTVTVNDEMVAVVADLAVQQTFSKQFIEECKFADTQGYYHSPSGL